MAFHFILLGKGRTAVLIGPNVGPQSFHRKCQSSKGQEEQAPLSVWVYLQKAGRGEGRKRNGKRSQKAREHEDQRGCGGSQFLCIV